MPPQELDLRLNPVTKNEPDYRLFIIHMLVKIRLLGEQCPCDSKRLHLTHLTYTGYD